MKKTYSRWYNPSVALSVGLLGCIIRVILKLVVGLIVGSVVLTGDGFHNIGDVSYILAAFLIMWIVQWKRDVLHAGENLGVLFQFIVAGILGALALYILYQSLIGLSSCVACERAVQGLFPFIPPVIPHELEAGAFGAIAGTLLTSIVISWCLATYHIEAGIVSGYSMLITIGKETKSDVLVEGALLLGFTGVYIFGTPKLEYIGGLVISWFIAKTGWELLAEASNTFLQASIGGEFVQGLTTLVSSTYGIGRIRKLEAYPVLQAARIKVFVETRGGADANEDIRNALERRIHAYAQGHGFSECRPDIFFTMPDNDWHRDVVAIRKDDETCFVAPDLARATHLRVCDIEYGEAVSAEDIPAPKDAGVLTELLIQKHARTYRAWSESEEVIAVLTRAHIAHERTQTIIPPSH